MNVEQKVMLKQIYNDKKSRQARTYVTTRIEIVTHLDEREKLYKYVHENETSLALLVKSRLNDILNPGVVNRLENSFTEN